MAGKRRFEISTPRDVIVQQTISGGSVKAQMKWNSNFGRDISERFSRAQMFIDSECLRLMDPLTPMRSGAMIRSATIGTVIGSGRIVYNSSYARRQYYENKGGSPKHPQAGKLWFERMKAQHKGAIKRGAARYLRND